MNQPDLFPTIPSRSTPRQIIRVELDAATSQTLDALGLPAFGVCHCERTRGHPRRWMLYLAELRHPAAQEAIHALKEAATSQPTKQS
jgi:hypothetical protein